MAVRCPQQATGATSMAIASADETEDEDEVADESVNVAALPEEPLQALSTDLPRSIDWGVMISDGVLYVSDGDLQHELPIEWLQGER